MGVGSLDIRSGSHSDELADADTARSPKVISNSYSHVVPNMGPIMATSFPLPFLVAFLQAFTLLLATLAVSSELRVGDDSDGGNEDTMEPKAAAMGSLPLRRWSFGCVKPGSSAPEQGHSKIVPFSAPLDLCSPRGPGA